MLSVRERLSASGGSSQCTTLPAGGATEDADFVVVLSALDSNICSGTTLAYATTCQRDQHDRPIFGFVNFCASQLASAIDGSWGEQLSTAVGGLLHALGAGAMHACHLMRELLSCVQCALILFSGALCTLTQPAMAAFGQVWSSWLHFSGTLPVKRAVYPM